MKLWQFEAFEQYTPLFAELNVLVAEFQRKRDAGDVDGAYAMLARIAHVTKKLAALDAEFGIATRRL